jgi:hypothetical protein
METPFHIRFVRIVERVGNHRSPSVPHAAIAAGGATPYGIDIGWMSA